jgi:hypothetical protein
VEAPGGRWYGPGDRIVTLAPNREGQLVTSQRGRVTATAVDMDGSARLEAVMDDGRPVALAGDDLSADRVDTGTR